MSTLLQGPYDHLPTCRKRRLQCMISDESYVRWFGPNGSFPLRGVQDKLLTRVFHLIDTFMMHHDLLENTPYEQREELLNNVMNSLDIHYGRTTTTPDQPDDNGDQLEFAFASGGDTSST